MGDDDMSTVQFHPPNHFLGAQCPCPTCRAWYEKARREPEDVDSQKPQRDSPPPLFSEAELQHHTGLMRKCGHGAPCQTVWGQVLNRPKFRAGYWCAKQRMFRFGIFNESHAMRNQQVIGKDARVIDRLLDDMGARWIQVWDFTRNVKLIIEAVQFRMRKDGGTRSTYEHREDGEQYFPHRDQFRVEGPIK